MRSDTTLASALGRCDAGSLVLECRAPAAAAAAAAASSPEPCPEPCPERAPSDGQEGGPQGVAVCCQLAPSGTLRPMVSKAWFGFGFGFGLG